MFQITTERPEDGAAIELLLDQAFGANRESKTSYRYRDGVMPVGGLKLVARSTAPGSRLLGTLRFWPVEIDGRTLDLQRGLGLRAAWEGREFVDAYGGGHHESSSVHRTCRLENVRSKATNRVPPRHEP